MAHIPLAWLQLVREKLRLLAALAGISFSAMLMLMQLGFRDALFDSAVLVHESLRGDLVLMSPMYAYLASTRTFTQRRLYQALAVDGVESVAPLYLSLGTWKNPDTRRESLILAFGIDAHARPFDLPGLDESLRNADLPEAVLLDSKSRPEVGPVAQWNRERREVVTEVNGHRVKVRGFFELGTSFGVNASIVTGETNFLRIFTQRSRGLIDLGVITLRKGTDPDAVAARLATVLPPDVRVMTRTRFSEYEKSYWARNSPVGFIFNLGTLMGLIVGAVIVYQILYSDVTDHLAEYATLKAMGYSDRRLFTIVAQEALILSALGYVPGFLIAQGLYSLTYKATFLPIFMTTNRGILVFVMTVLMCLGAGGLAMRKLRTADPAEVF